MSVSILFTHVSAPLSFECISMSGYTRPLNGEAANLSVVAAHEKFHPVWLGNPPLGQACTVYSDGETVMAGALYGVKATASAIELSIEA